MSSIIFKHGTKAEIDATAKVEGQVLFSTDQTPNDKIYYDKDSATRIPIGGKDEVDTTLNASSNNPIANSAIAGVMLTTMNEVNAVTQSGTLPDSLALKQLATTVANLQTSLNNYWQTIFPVGSFYISGSSTFDPNVTFGGTWAKIEDRFLLGASSTTALGSTGGEKTHTLTIDEMPKHRHNPMKLAYGEASASPTGLNYGSVSVGDQNFNWLAEVGGNQPHNNMPPYLAVNIWKRTA